jgi:2-oxoglutarate dehydrogenase E2 component (dihydrolipoamide succinyltransferase)
MARIDVIMPQMGESITEGTLSRWMKKVGEEIKRDEPIFEISTDKVDAEIPAPNAGTLVEILVQEGQTVAVQTVVARIETDKSAASSAPAPAAAPPAAAPPPPAPAAAAPAPAVRAPAPSAQPAPAPRPAVAATVAETADDRLRRRSTPLVRKMAADHGIDITALQGSGLAGRVTKQDLLGAIGDGSPAPADARSAAVMPAAPSLAAAAASPPPRPAAPPGAPHAAPAVEAWEGDRVEPWSRIRKLTADHMVMSRRVSAHVNSLFEIDYTHVAQLRARKKKEYAERGVNLTYLAFITKAVAENLRKHPGINAAVSGEATIYRRDVNIGIAVALDWGLIVPVIKHADELSLLGTARAINDLGERARGKKLTPDEVQKGTFTITNPGVFGSLVGLPIINQPQAAILGIGTIEKRASVITLPDGTDTLGIRTKGMIAMAFDHRIVDGADADRFLADIKKMLEHFPESAV